MPLNRSIRPDRPHRSPGLLTGLALTTALAGLVALPVASTAAASPAASPAASGCRIKNTTTGVVKQSLQGALNAAASGQTLEVRGTCSGRAVIIRPVTIVGRPSATYGKPVVSGGDSVRAITVRLGVKPVVIRDLTIRDGLATGDYPAHAGGGIFNEGWLTLTDVVVRDNVATKGGGIYTAAGVLTLKGTTRVRNNRASASDDGGGIYVDATDSPASVVMRGSSRVDHNTAQHGGGIRILFGSVTMRDAATVDHNTALFASGIDVQGSLAMEDTSAVRDNQRLNGALSGSAIEVWASTVDQNPAPSITMTGSSRVKGNVAGTGGAGVASYPDCGPDPVLSGLTATRVTGNTPANKVVIAGC